RGSRAPGLRLPAQLGLEPSDVDLVTVEQTVQVDADHVGAAVDGRRIVGHRSRRPEPLVRRVVGRFTPATIVSKNAVALGIEIARAELARQIAGLQRTAQLVPEPIEVARLELRRLSRARSCIAGETHPSVAVSLAEGRDLARRAYPDVSVLCHRRVE